MAADPFRIRSDTVLKRYGLQMKYRLTMEKTGFSESLRCLMGMLIV